MARTSTRKLWTRADAPAAATVAARHLVAIAVLLVLLVVAAFGPGVGIAFVSWDDPENFLENPFYRGLGWSQVCWALTSFQVGVYQPLAWVILEAQYVLFGLNPWGYHLVSLILYAINTVVLFLLTQALLLRCRSGPGRADSWRLVLGAALAVGLFAVHPLRTEVVAWASCQPYLPCALFSMLAVLVYLRAFPAGAAPRLGWLVGAFLLFAAALLSKAVALSLPLVFLVLDVYPLRRLGAGGGPGRWFGPGVRRVWLEKLPLAGMSLIVTSLAVAARAKEQQVTALASRSVSWRICQACYAIWFYVIKTLVPTDIIAFYPVPERVGLRELPFLLSLIGTVSVSVGLFLLRRRSPGLLAVWLSYLVILAPNLGLVRIGDALAADRYSYIAMMGGVVLLAAALAHIWGVGERSWPAAAGLSAASLGVLVVLILLSRSQCRTWRTSEALWSHALRHGANRSPEVHIKLGAALSDRGRLEDARAQYAEAIRLNPDHADAHNNLGVVLFRQGRLNDARALYARAIRLNPDHADAHNNLGVVLSRQGRLSDARAQYARAIRLNPDHADAHNNLGVVLFRQGRLEDARAHCAEAIRLNPNHADAHNNLGIALTEQGRLEEARAQCAEALRIEPSHADAHDNLGVVLFRQGRLEDARTQYAEAIRLNPDHIDAHNNLGVVLLAQGRLAEAETEFAAALQLDPNHPKAHNSLGVVLFRQGRFAEALAQYTEALRLNPNNAGLHKNCALLWATAPLEKYRDGHRAVESATRACELTGWNEPGTLAALAAAYAEAGNFEKAVNWQRRATDFLTDEAMRNDFRCRLKLYQGRQPYREAIEQR